MFSIWTMSGLISVEPSDCAFLAHGNVLIKREEATFWWFGIPSQLKMAAQPWGSAAAPPH